MSVQEIGRTLVELCNQGRFEDAVREFYSPEIVSIEAFGNDQMPARVEGLAAVAEKGQWWTENHDVHSTSATGPFVGHREDQFAVTFDMDLTPKGGERLQMSEVALYTVRDGRIVQEEFLYRA
jgi:ketosteroid isomerase-like protein